MLLKIKNSKFLYFEIYVLILVEGGIEMKIGGTYESSYKTTLSLCKNVN